MVQAARQMQAESAEAMTRLAAQASAWGVTVERTFETASSVLAFGRRGNEAVVVKIVRGGADEGSVGRVLEELDGHGTVRVYAHLPGAALMERLRPATPLVALCRRSEDAAATDILADIVDAMAGTRARIESFPAVAEWGESLQAYVKNWDGQIPKDLVERAAECYAALCASQAGVRLLHGDLHHYNVLLDSRRGWLAVDPKGVVGELEYELGASLRNPYEALDEFAAPNVIERRVRQYEARLGVDPGRVMGWAFSQAVLAGVWEIQDGSATPAGSPFLRLAISLWPMLE
jgi:streptomycin 6-kinase